MAQSIVRYADAGQIAWGRLIGDAPTRAGDRLEIAALATQATTTQALIAALDHDPSIAGSGPSKTISASQLLSPVTSDATLVCQGLNYGDHAAEAGHHTRKANLFFAKASSSLSGPYDDIIKPLSVELLDYEVEVGVVLRKPISRGLVVGPDDVGSYIAGVVLCNDVSARDVMFSASFFQWYQGKSYRTFCPTGPVLYLLEPSEVGPALENLEIALRWNDEPRQSANTANLIYRPAETLTQLAEIMDLVPGDMVLTGTPGGVIAQGTPKLIEIFKTNLLEDSARRDAMRTEMKTLGRFLEAGDSLTLTLRDGRAGLALGGQHCRIADQDQSNSGGNP
jgi:2-keto-4-pentenoate hydratase/2-oxohepta-3-ene-1,7-dioic acid hydratase in catechol pathway